LNLIVYGFLAPIAGSLGDRWKPQRIMAIGLIILGLATAGCAFARELWHFYLLLGFVAPIGNACAGWPLLGPAIANWFAKKRGLAMGLGQIGAGLSFTYGMYAEFAISQLGWRHAYFVLAGTLWVILLPLYFFFFHSRPENKGLKPYGAEEQAFARPEAPQAPKTSQATTGDWTLRRAIGTYQLWLLMLSYFLFWGIGTYLVISHQVKFAEDVGYSSTFAASIFALSGIFQIGGQLSSGISDRIGREMTITFACTLMIAALIALVSVNDTSRPWLLYIFAVCFGYGCGFFTPTMTAGTADIFYGKHFGTIAGMLLTGMGIGGVIGPWLGGYIHDITGSYTSAFILCMAAFALSCTAFWLAAPRNAARLNAKIMRGSPPPA